MKKLALLLALALMLTFTCAALADSISVAVVYSDTVDDKGWCQSMDTGIKNAIARGYEIDYTPVESVAIPDAPNTLDQLADNYDIIIVHGAQFTSACTEVAAEYPEQVFAIGTKAKKVGIVGPTDGGDSARFIRGFVKALQDTDPTVEYMLSWTGSFSDTVGAGDIGKTFIEAGCDVLVGPSQQAVGALRNVDAAEGVTWVGQTTSQIVDFPNVVVAAADYDYAAVVIGIMERMAEGKIGGENIPLNYNNGGFIYTFSENPSLLPEDVKAAAQAALNSMIAAPNTVDFSGIELK